VTAAGRRSGGAPPRLAENDRDRLGQVGRAQPHLDAMAAAIVI
jgi:hypothetical protein